MMHVSLICITIAVAFQTVAAFIDIKQLATTPSQCESTCSSANATFTSCVKEEGPGPCICNESFLTTLTNCFECAAQIQGVTDFSNDQTQLDAVVSTCDALGSPLQKVTLPGQNPNRIIATSAIASGTQGSTVSIPSSASSSALPLTSGTSSTVTLPSSAVPTATSPSSASGSSANTTSASPSSALSSSSSAVSSSSSSSSTSSSSTASPSSSTSGASSTFEAISGLSSILVGAGLILLFA